MEEKSYNVLAMQIKGEESIEIPVIKLYVLVIYQTLPKHM